MQKKCICAQKRVREIYFSTSERVPYRGKESCLLLQAGIPTCPKEICIYGKRHVKEAHSLKSRHVPWNTSWPAFKSWYVHMSKKKCTYRHKDMVENR